MRSGRTRMRRCWRRWRPRAWAPTWCRAGNIAAPAPPGGRARRSASRAAARPPRRWRRRGLGAGVGAGGRARRARAAGVAGEKIVFSGVGKTAAEMALALEGGIGQFNLESLSEAEMLSDVALSLGRRAPAAFRVNPDVPSGSHAKISTGAA